MWRLWVRGFTLSTLCKVNGMPVTKDKSAWAWGRGTRWEHVTRVLVQGGDGVQCCGAGEEGTPRPSPMTLVSIYPHALLPPRTFSLQILKGLLSFKP